MRKLPFAVIALLFAVNVRAQVSAKQKFMDHLDGHWVGVSCTTNGKIIAYRIRIMGSPALSFLVLKEMASVAFDWTEDQLDQMQPGMGKYHPKGVPWTDLRGHTSTQEAMEYPSSPAQGPAFTITWESGSGPTALQRLATGTGSDFRTIFLEKGTWEDDSARDKFMAQKTRVCRKLADY